MPFKTNADLPKYVRKYGEKIQSQARHVFNSVYGKVFKETKDKKQAERRAFMAMHSVLKKRFTKGQNSSSESHNDYIKQLIDGFLGNLSG